MTLNDEIDKIIKKIDGLFYENYDLIPHERYGIAISRLWRSRNNLAYAKDLMESDTHGMEKEKS